MLGLPGSLGLCTGAYRAGEPGWLVVAVVLLVVALLPTKWTPVTWPVQVAGTVAVLAQVPVARSILGGVGVLLLLAGAAVNAAVWVQARLTFGRSGE